MKSSRSPNSASSWRAILKIVLAIVLALLGKKQSKTPAPPANRNASKDTPSRPSSSSPKTGSSDTGDDQTIARLFARRQSDQIVTTEGIIVKILADDLYDEDGSGQHQQFLVEVAGDVTIKIAHNLKFSRIPVREGRKVRFKGEYEWNERGGCIHWTHHDPKGWHEDGWIEYDGKMYD